MGAPGTAGGSQTLADYPFALRSTTVGPVESVRIDSTSVPALATYGNGPIAIAVHAFTAGSYDLSVTCQP